MHTNGALQQPSCVLCPCVQGSPVPDQRPCLAPSALEGQVVFMPLSFRDGRRGRAHLGWAGAGLPGTCLGRFGGHPVFRPWGTHLHLGVSPPPAVTRVGRGPGADGPPLASLPRATWPLRHLTCSREEGPGQAGCFRESAGSRDFHDGILLVTAFSSHLGAQSLPVPGCKSNFLIGMYTQEETSCIQGLVLSVLRHPWGSWSWPLWTRGSCTEG